MSNYSLIEINRNPFEHEWNDELELRLYFRDKTNPLNSNCEESILVPDDEFESEEEPIHKEIKEKDQIILDRYQLIGEKYLENIKIKEIKGGSAPKKEEENKPKNNEETNASIDKIEKNKEQSHEQNKSKYIGSNQTILKDTQFLKSEKELNEFKSKEKIDLETKIFPKIEEGNNYNLIKTNKIMI